MDQPPFLYQPKCSTAGCDRHGLYKVAAPWSYGNIRELKNYGVCCEDHRDGLLERAREKVQDVDLAEGEEVGEIGVYRLLPGVSDRELSRLE